MAVPASHVRRMKIRIGRSTLVGLSLLVPALAGAADGGAIYNAYCAACHGDDGKGAVAGVFPPLAGSEWVAGDPERSIQVVLHGLVGPVSVAGTE